MILNQIASSSMIYTEAGIVTIMPDTGIPEYGVLIVATLIWLLAAREILSHSDRWNDSLDCSLKMTSFPLLVTFFAMVIFKISEL